MRFVRYDVHGTAGLAVETDGGWRGTDASNELFPGDLAQLLISGDDALHAAADRLARGAPVDVLQLRHTPPLLAPGKILCVGLNFEDHTAEVSLQQPNYPTVFTRVASTLVGHGEPLVRPAQSLQFDYEGEIALIIGKGGRHIERAEALQHIAGWSLFNDASVRDYQFKSSQWTMGKNFDASGAFGPFFVTADELPPGCAGLSLETRLNGTIVQRASTDDMIFKPDVLISLLSEVMTLSPGDVIVTGTPSGVGMARKPPLWMVPGDVVEVAAPGLGVLRNPVVAARAHG